MYLRRFTIAGVKCFDAVEILFPHHENDYSGWVVLLGSNGTGKTTLLQAMALALIGPLASQRLLLPGGWASTDADYGRLEAELARTDQDSQATGHPRKRPYEVTFAVTGNKTVELDGQPYDQPQIVHLDSPQTRKALAVGPYAAKRPGWFSCGYGPFRRLSGGDSADAALVHSQGREARFATLFRESAALTLCQDWLTQLYSRSIDPSNPDQGRHQATLAVVRKVIDGLMPFGVSIEKIDTTRVWFRTVGGATVMLSDLSDGFRSFLSLAIDILRHLVESNADLGTLVAESESGEKHVNVEGVVLIDEADVHLHPLWQRSIGFELRRAFPRIQFIVTTHSPFVAQAATDNGLIVLRPGADGRVQAVRPIESVKGWKAEEILTSPLFGLTGTRDIPTELMIREHSDLVAKREYEKLTSGERGRLTRLETTLSTRMTAGETPQERGRQQKMQSYIDETLAALGGGK